MADYKRERDLRELAQQEDPEGRLVTQQPFVHSTQEELGKAIYGSGKTETLDLFDIPVNKVTKKVSSDDLFYAAATNGFDPVADYKQAKLEVAQTGESSLFNLAQQKWMEEQDQTAKEVITSLMLDVSVPDYEKRAAINTYVGGGYIDKSLRTKYLTQQAALDNSTNELEKQAQDIVANSLLARNQQALQEEAVKGIEEADIDFSDVLKGTTAVGAQIALSIPAGLAALWPLIKEQNPDKANEILRAIQEWGYNPEDAGAQKVIQKFQAAMEWLDTPFKWLGDKVLEFTGSPGAATTAYTASSLVGYLGAYKGAKAVVKGVRKSSPLGTTTTANPANANTLATAALVDPTNELAKALGTTKESIISDYTLPKVTQDLAHRPDLMENLIETDRRLSGLFEETRIDPNIYPKSVLEADKARYVAIMTQAKGPKLLQSQSALDFEWTEQSTFLKAKALFGRDSNFGYTTELAAETAANQLRQSVKGLPEEGNVTVISRQPLGPQQPPEYFVQWEFKREYDPLDHLTMGQDALQAHLLSKNWNVTEFANKWGTYIWPAYMRMKSWIPSVGQSSGLKQARIEGDFLKSQRDLVLGTKHPKELNSLLRSGEDQGKVWTLSDVKNQYPNLKVKEAEDLFASYYGYRRIEDHLYSMSDRKYRYNLEKEGYQTLYDQQGNKLGFASLVDKIDELPSYVWDFTVKAVVKYNPDKPIVKLRNPVRIGDDYYNYANLGKTELGPIRSNALPKIPGYISRQYKEWYVLEREPKKASVDGKKITEQELRNYRQAVAIESTEVDVKALQAEFQRNYPDATFHWRKERKDIEDKIMFDSQIFDSFFKEHLSRGKKLPARGREATVEDVLVAQTKTIMTIARLEAFGPYMEHARKEFVKSYGEFTDHKFPDQITDIKPKSRMTPDEEARFLSAQKVYQQLELQQFSEVMSDELWKNAFNKLGDIFEKSALAKAAAIPAREVGRKGMIPVRAAKLLGSHLWLYTRPLRMWLVQPQQWLELSTMNPKYAAQSMLEAPVLLQGLLANNTRLLKGIKAPSMQVGRNTIPDFDKTIKALEEWGVMQAVDTNQMIHGIWRDSMDELIPSSKLKSVADKTQKIASAPSHIGRSIGYDPAELLNQITLWLYAKQKWTKENPGKDWSVPENAALIGQLAGRLGHMASTRAGLMPFQEGVLSMLAQFVAIPHKSFMMMVSHPDLTGREKARLLGARLFWYGKWSIPGGAVIYSMLEKELPEETSENLNRYTRGASDFIMNETLNTILGDTGDSYWSKSMSTVPESLFHWDIVNMLVDMADGTMDDKMRFPFVNATSSWFQAANDIYQMYNIPTITGDDPNWTKTAWLGAKFVTLTTAGSVRDIEAALLGEQITKTGQKLGHTRTASEIVGTLFGVQTSYEAILWDMLKKKGKREDFIKEEGKKIHETTMTYLRNNDLEGFGKYWDIAGSFLKSIPEEYKEDIMREIQQWDRRSQETVGDSIGLYILDKYRKENDGAMNELRNLLKHTGDERLTKINEVLE